MGKGTSKAGLSKDLISIGIQANRHIYKAFKLASVMEERNMKDLVNDAILCYLKERHPDMYEELNKPQP